jgi:hypothetical protein
MSKLSFFALLCLALGCSAAPNLVICHYMLWVPSTSDDLAGFKNDINLARSFGIDAFILNTADWSAQPWPKPRTDLIWQAADELGGGFKLAFSADMTNSLNAGDVVDMVQRYANRTSTLKVDGKVFLSTFVGQNTVDWQGGVFNPLQQKFGISVYFIPFFDGDPNGLFNQYSFLSGLFHWTAWPYAGDLQSPNDNLDKQYKSAAQSHNKAWMAPVSPYFAKHYGGLPDGAKPNWVFGNYKGAGLYIDRWEQLIADQPNFIEIVTWNDYPEASYIGPISTVQYGTWGNAPNGVVDYDRRTYPHTAYGDLSKYYIQVYKTGNRTVGQDKVYVFYRSYPKTLNCNDRTGMGKQQNADSMQDDIYVVTLLRSPANVVINSGSSSKTFENVPAGVSTSSIPFGLGSQNVQISRNGQTIGQKTFAKQITGSCDLYDANTFSDWFTL